MDNGRDAKILERKYHGRWKKRLRMRDFGEMLGGRREINRRKGRGSQHSR